MKDMILGPAEQEQVSAPKWAKTRPEKKEQEA